jgi:hypothetical protein
MSALRPYLSTMRSDRTATTPAGITYSTNRLNHFSLSNTVVDADPQGFKFNALSDQDPEPLHH